MSAATAGAGLDGLDPVLSAPKRLAAMALLRRADWADFGYLREHLGVSESDLSKQLSTLQESGYVSTTKTGRGRGGSTTFRITTDGVAAYDRHRDAPRAILG